MVFDIANVDKVSFIWFEFDAVKEDRVPLEATRRSPITNYLRQSLLHSITKRSTEGKKLLRPRSVLKSPIDLKPTTDELSFVQEDVKPKK